MNTPKYMIKQDNEIAKLFDNSRHTERELRIYGKKFVTDINLDLPDYYEFERLLQQTKIAFETSAGIQLQLMKLSASSTDKNVERSSYKVLLTRKANLVRQNLKKRHLQLIFIVNQMIKLMLGLCYNTDIIINGALLLATLHNLNIGLAQNKQNATGAMVCSNTFPGLLSQPKKIDINIILQTISKHRAEQCCLALITCLLNTCKPDAPPSDSETSSLEILKTLTTHLLPTESLTIVEPNARNPVNCMELHVSHPGPTLSESEFNDSTSKFFDNMAKETVAQVMGTINYMVNDDNDQMDQLEELIAEEEIFIANILMKCVQLCPSAFDGKITKDELAKAMEKGSRNLWTQIGGILEQLVVWWSSSPLCCRPVNCAKYLREWLMLLVEADAPEPIYSTLKGLGESLTVYVTSTMWDKQFRLCLVSSSLPVEYPYEEAAFLGKSEDSNPAANPGCVPGRLWRDLLSGIVAISNTCDRIGTIPNELPIVEQIPVLHRLDHSIHTMRLWAQRLAKSLCSDWNMKMFFRVVEKDIGICLEQLKELRVPQLATPDALEVHVQVNVALRAKLVSEIKVNIDKLKLTTQECINVLAAICRTTSLATFSLCFPTIKQWQCNYLQERANDYVAYFLQQIFLSVLEATHDVEIMKLCLKIICEAWLDHIYMKKVKFSYCGALNLLKDFDGVAEWINQCPAIIDDQHRVQLAKHEVLRMCEGVGRILLRKPDEVISMLPSPKHFKRGESNEQSDEKAPLPPEMFVPNQKRWLELRARNRSILNLDCLCFGGSNAYKQL